MLKCFTVCLFTFFTAVSLAAELTVPANIKILTVNGQDYGFSIFAKESTIELLAGENVLHLQFKELYEDIENDDHTTITSKPFVLSFQSDGFENLVLTTPTFKTEQQIKRFAKSPKVILFNSKNKALPVLQQDAKEYLAQQRVDKAISKLTASEFPKLTQATRLTQPETNPSHSETVQKSQDNMPLEMLSYWWSKANIQQRRQFIEQVKNEFKQGN